MLITCAIVLIPVLICISFYNREKLGSLFYGYVKIEDIQNNKELLTKELEFINNSINGLSGLALSATGSLVAVVFNYKDKVYDEVGDLKLLMIFAFLATIGIYVVVYSLEMLIKNKYKKDLIEKLAKFTNQDENK